MIASVHIADVGARSALALVRKAPRPASIPGLRHADVGLAAALSGSLLAKPDTGRVALVAFWDGDADVERFLAGHATAAKLAGGWHARLAPLRAFGSWPGLPSDTPTTRAVDQDAPAVVITLGRLRLSQALRFLRASARAEGAVVEAPGLAWATGFARPPFVATCSLWTSTRQLSAYAFAQGPHHDAIVAADAKAFHKQSAFIRFRPYASAGVLGGKNPLAADALG